jgi:hypothetical protein
LLHLLVLKFSQSEFFFFMANSNAASGQVVDIVASRDLVRNYQRRIRSVVDVPASKLALVIDAPSDAMDGGQQQHHQANDQAAQPRREALEELAREREKRMMQSTYQMLRRQQRVSAAPKVYPSLHDSLVAAITQSERSAAAVGGSPTQHASPSLRSHLRSGNAAMSAEQQKEAAERRVRNAYQAHQAEIRTKHRPSKQVLRAQTKTLPVILERECNSQLRHNASTRCYYYDERTCRPSGAAYGYTGPMLGDDLDFYFDDCDVALAQETSEAGPAADKQQEQQQSSREAKPLPAMEKKRRDNSPVILKYKQRVPVPIEQRPSFTFVSPIDYDAQTLLERRRHAVTPPKLTSVPTPYQEKRRHVSPRVGRWQPCYAVGD